MMIYTSRHKVKGGCWYTTAFANLHHFNCNAGSNIPNLRGFRVVKLIKTP